ncbi:DUF2637 domain-containing protein [Virgisporangium aurantiacum]|uniref:DUF2637 domain-containing protein n=1 Tax=Virgisporangium aurantiacum TaxID=175570 RepID=A0A8J3ZHX4_9ACTN|nr:DUF2637 domain-containing protein [Virgisporangium aurantiacum]GIJ63123.1 hypothetical protein Vau01_106390 [Virgisporangium aurantiacum]
MTAPAGPTAGPAAAAVADPASASPLSTHSRAARIAMGILLVVVGVLLAAVVCTPTALSSQDLIDWAAAPTGLGLPRRWSVLVVVALDAAAGVCVLLTVYCAWRGEPAGVFGVLVWCFAFGSAFANYRHSTVPDAAPDAVWFFPLMSVAGPALLEAVLGRFRRWYQRDTGRRSRRLPAFGWRRWIPGLGAPRDTYGAYRTALLLGIDTVDNATAAYHQLCPDGSLHVAAALRARHAAQTVAELIDATRSGQVTALPVDIMRRIPVDPAAYQRWLRVWADLEDNPADLGEIAKRHGFSRRQIQFVRRAGEAGLLNSTTPPAVRLAELAAASNHHRPTTGSSALAPDSPPRRTGSQ